MTYMCIYSEVIHSILISEKKNSMKQYEQHDSDFFVKMSAHTGSMLVYLHWKKSGKYSKVLTHSSVITYNSFSFYSSKFSAFNNSFFSYLKNKHSFKIILSHLENV